MRTTKWKGKTENLNRNVSSVLGLLFSLVSLVFCLFFSFFFVIRITDEYFSWYTDLFSHFFFVSGGCFHFYMSTRIVKCCLWFWLMRTLWLLFAVFLFCSILFFQFRNDLTYLQASRQKCECLLNICAVFFPIAVSLNFIVMWILVFSAKRTI